MGTSEAGRPVGRDGGRSAPGLPSGNAPCGALPVRPRDRVVRAVCRALPPLWAACGWRRAAGMLRHYLRGGGEPYEVDAEEVLRLPVVRASVARHLRRWRAEAAGRGVGTHRADSGWRGALITRRGSVDWWLALRGVQYRLSGTVRVAEDGRMEVAYRFQVHKSWNFDRGQSEFGVPFAPFARLHETGLAREFVVMGTAPARVDRAGAAPLPPAA
ncbi:hypothetical protein [Streptomyces sp. NPDC003077]|uniref:hypothetical protein n=1 Tax=Streptomyces sp. NPDC003077 TaxID=3154443 RepID=UPI0033BA4BBC